jgi:hypothetical protein
MSAYFFWSMRRISIFAGCEGGHESTAKAVFPGSRCQEISLSTNAPMQYFEFSSFACAFAD